MKPKNASIKPTSNEYPVFLVSKEGFSSFFSCKKFPLPWREGIFNGWPGEQFPRFKQHCFPVFAGCREFAAKNFNIFLYLIQDGEPCIGDTSRDSLYTHYSFKGSVFALETPAGILCIHTILLKGVFVHWRHQQGFFIYTHYSFKGSVCFLELSKLFSF